MTENMQYQRWLDFPLEDPALKEELLGIKGKEEEREFLLSWVNVCDYQ